MMDSPSVAFDRSIMHRYDRAGPRYTSYPSALQFRPGLDAGAYAEAVEASPGALDAAPLSMYVHLPFCFSPCFYCGCNKVVTRHLNRVDSYVRHLLQEVSYRGAYFNRNRVVQQLHFGGGTPTFLPKKLLVELMQRIDRHFQLTDSETRDYSIEIDPRGADRGVLQLLAALGFNRISLGVQDFDDDVQRAINRVQPIETVAKVYDAARAIGFSSINFDLIYGLPNQTPATFAATLDRVIDMRPDRLAVYGYAHMPGRFKAQRMIRETDLPDPETRLTLLQATIDKLCAAGYVYIGLDHFALSTDSLVRALDDGGLHRNFQGYTTHANRDLVNLGMSAIGQVGSLYMQNHRSLNDYEKAIALGELPSARGAWMSRDDFIRGDVIQGIMCRGAVDMTEIEDRYQIDFSRYFSKELLRLRLLSADGLVVLSAGHIKLTPVGRLLMRNVAMSFDAYLGGEARSAQMSRAI
jgi:oxygen-independent coproporphyrinogen-3 oxidase